MAKQHECQLFTSCFKGNQKKIIIFCKEWVKYFGFCKEWGKYFFQWYPKRTPPPIKWTGGESRYGYLVTDCDQAGLPIHANQNEEAFLSGRFYHQTCQGITPNIQHLTVDNSPEMKRPSDGGLPVHNR